jgi:hypothetical protein
MADMCSRTIAPTRSAGATRIVAVEVATLGHRGADKDK